ncbi:MAG: hypothetical protein ACOH1I_10845 [Gallionellaceae bacterium]
MRQRFSKLGRIAGLDAQVLPTLLLRGWQIIAGGVMVLLIPLWLGKVEQGYYYTFSSLLALQIFFELGMNQVIIQLVSHDFAHVSVSDSAALKGDAIRLDRLASLVVLLRRWYAIAASLFFVIVSACGAWFFSTKGDLPISDWGGAWLMLTLVTAANLYLSAALTVLEGCGEVAGVARMRLVQSMCGNSLMWIALALGAGLWAMPLVLMVAAAYTSYWLRINGSTIERLRRHFAESANNIKINWRADIFPFQWRIAVSWISGYFIFQLFTPLAFARLGAVEAGRLGITMAVFTALLTVGMSWINAKLPAFAAHVSRNERVSLNMLFNSVVKRSIAFTLFATLTIIAIVMVMNSLDIAAVHRFASLPVVICLAIVTLVNCFIFAAAAYMRAHKEEPMMLVSVATGLATLTAAAVGSMYGVFTMMFLYAMINVCVALPWTIYIFMPYYRRATL